MYIQCDILRKNNEIFSLYSVNNNLKDCILFRVTFFYTFMYEIENKNKEVFTSWQSISISKQLF